MKKHKRIQAKTILRLLNAMPEWMAEYRHGRVFAYWQHNRNHYASYPVLTIPDNSFLVQITMRHSQHGNLHLNWFDSFYGVADIARVTKEIHRVFAFSMIPIDTKVAV